jgi:1-acyl-sn-glycerol-3-phosphate acyltransferase
MKTLFRLYLTIAFWGMNILFIVVIFIPFCIIMLLRPQWGWHFAVAWGRCCVKSCFLPVKVVGRENIPAGPVILACNHTSMLDIHLLLGYFPKRFHFLMKEELFKIPLFGTAVTLLGFYPLNRSNPKRALETMQNVIAHLKEGESLMIFPEGTRNAGPDLLQFKNGMAKIAVEAQVPVLPIAVVGCNKVNPSTKKLLHWHRLEIRIGQPLNPPFGTNRSDIVALTEQTRQQVQQLKN